MFITCISASNIRHAREYSTSTSICSIVKKIVEKKCDDKAEVNIITLVDHELNPCIGCGMCYKKDRCAHDDTFNIIYEKLKKSDAVFITAAHYAPLPAKLSMLMEKMEQIAFLGRFNDEGFRSPLYKKPLGVIAHGGGTVELTGCYKKVVLDCIENALSWPIEMNIVGVDGTWPNGVVIPITKVTKSDDSIFPIQEYDWDGVERSIEPLVENVINNIYRSI